MRDYKKTNAPESTVTFDREKIQGNTENIYEAIAVIARRADQINAEIKQELIEKLDEFATHNDSLEEVFENKEQIEVSRFYERLPKSSSIAIKEWLDGDIYYRNPNKEEK
jgi:DNA-directed RNA polymerase subunit K/omega